MFTYIDSKNEHLAELRKQFKLLDLVDGIIDDFEKVKVLCEWTHQQLYHLPVGNESNYTDPQNILNEAITNKKGFRCIEFAIVLNGLINAIGIVSRIVFLHRKGIEKLVGGATHAVVEAFLPSYGKWVLFDAAYNKYVLLNNIPLNSYETLINYNAIEDSSYIISIYNYLYYFETYYDNHVFIANSEVNSKRLMFIAKGCYEPKVYQRKYTLMNINYTMNFDDFYIVPSSNHNV